MHARIDFTYTHTYVCYVFDLYEPTLLEIQCENNTNMYSYTYINKYYFTIVVLIHMYLVSAY